MLRRPSSAISGRDFASSLAQLGAHILIGAAIGLGLRIGIAPFERLDFLREGIPTFNSLLGTGNPLHWMASHARTLQNAMAFGFIVRVSDSMRVVVFRNAK